MWRAGLRSFNLGMPEEVNRILTDRISEWLFTPTAAAAEHLVREGADLERIIPVGDVMYDVAIQHGARVCPSGGGIEEFGLSAGGYVLATVHRAENTDDPNRLAAIVEALVAVGRDLPVVWPLHPRTRRILASTGNLDSLARGVIVVDPVGYLRMVQLEKYAAVIATDSGGVQKEAFFHCVPCVTLRDETEWVELVNAGWNRLASPASATAMQMAIRAALGTTGEDVAPYGNGDAATRIASRLLRDVP